MKKEVWEYIENNQMIRPRDLVLVACSGGADSLALLLLLCEESKSHDFAVEAVHIEHGIRGEQSMADAQFVQKLCEQRKIPCTVHHVQVPEFARKEHLGLEEAARILRYRRLEETAQKRQSDTGRNVRVAVAHHGEDNAETILFQIARGSGMQGLCGMAPVWEKDNITYIRPLLGCTRAQIEAYLQGQGQTFCTDETNADETFSRNRIRSQVIPQLCMVNVKAVEHMNETAGQLAAAWDYITREADSAYDHLVTEADGRWEIGIPSLKKLHPFLQSTLVLELMARAAGRRKDLSSVHVQSVLELMKNQSGREVALPYGLCVTREYDHLIFSKRQEKKSPFSIEISAEQLQQIKSSGEPRTIMLEAAEDRMILEVVPYNGTPQEIEKKTYTKTFDYDMMKRGFCVRNRREGDYFTLDREGHHKKLPRYFIDEHIPAGQRDACLLLAQESEIIWHVGGRIGERYKVTGDTKDIVRITICGGKTNGLFKEA